MIDGRCYNRKGEKISEEECMQKLSTDYKFIASTDTGKFFISTVWLGCDHSFSENSPIELFETMVFPYKGAKVVFLDVDCRRYSTEEEALKGHEEMVKIWSGDESNS